MKFTQILYIYNIIYHISYYYIIIYHISYHIPYIIPYTIYHTILLYLLLYIYNVCIINVLYHNVLRRTPVRWHWVDHMGPGILLLQIAIETMAQSK